MSLFESAAAFALERHSGTTRKLSKAPYVLHPMEAAVIASTMTDDEAVLAAALLHDTVEDAGVDPQEILVRFGPEVARLVDSETEKRGERPSDGNNWLERKSSSLEELRNADVKVKILWLSDKLANLRSFARGFRRDGNAIWQNFHMKDPVKQRWYYVSVAEAVSELRDTAAYAEFTLLIGFVFDGKSLRNGGTGA